MFGYFKNRRRQQLLAEPLPADLVDVLRRNVAIYSLLAPAEQERLLEATKIIACERPFYGVGKLALTDEIVVTIAAQAALLVLNGDGYYFDRARSILVYRKRPHVRMAHALGGVELVEEGVEISGQLLEQGEVRLVWKEVLASGRNPSDGYNVVLHEFAHHLDWLDGEVDGTPPLPRDAIDDWEYVFDMILGEHRTDCRAGRQTLLPDHAADSRAELFAYSAELFFELPRELDEWYPELFECLLSFYKTDPRRWFREDSETARRQDGET